MSNSAANSMGAILQVKHANTLKENYFPSEPSPDTDLSRNTGREI